MKADKLLRELQRTYPKQKRLRGTMPEPCKCRDIRHDGRCLEAEHEGTGVCLPCEGGWHWGADFGPEATL